jgi:hypothetical protein
VKGRRIIRPGDPLLNAHKAGATQFPSRDGWKFIRRGGHGHVDGAYAAGAVLVAMTMPVPAKARFRSFSY